MIVKCDLGGWRLTRCNGSYEKGFKPLERVSSKIPDFVKRAKNRAIIKQHKEYHLGFYGHIGNFKPESVILPYPETKC